MKPRINNRNARRFWLTTQALAATPTGPLDVLGIIKQLGFVQLDTIRVLARAHDHILWSRNQHYREPMLQKLLAKERAVFEHFTHDASVLPMAFYPFWRRQFHRQADKILKAGWYKSMPDADGRAAIKARIVRHGPLSARDFESKRPGKPEVWSRSPHKLALDFMWYAGELSTSHRENFNKFYDLSERIIPAPVLADERSDSDQVDWLCRAALDRLGIATPGEIQRFWDAVGLDEVKDWAKGCRQELIEVEVEAADGALVTMIAWSDLERRLAATPTPTSRLRILNPFDPAIRDRDRLSRLFGFDYRIEIFVPPAKRRFGYYVFPLLEGDRFVGRLEARADRGAGRLSIENLWTEPKVLWGPKRHARLEAELERLGRFVGTPDIAWTRKPDDLLD